MLALRIREASPGLASAFVQLAYPWLRTRGSARLPEEVEPPEGVLAGLLAQNTLTRGAYRSAAGQPTTDAYAVFPEVTSDQLTERRAAAGAPAMTGLALHERVSIFGNTPAGLLLLSDVTTSLDESYRPASVNRLVSLVVRAARIVGEESVFEPSGERLWVELRERLSTLLLQLYRAGALRGANAAEAFSVRCDRSTTSQNDLDAGRVIAEIGIDDSGQVALVGDAARQDAA
jgi:phage tail sheath protein FI